MGRSPGTPQPPGSRWGRGSPGPALPYRRPRASLSSAAPGATRTACAWLRAARALSRTAPLSVPPPSAAPPPDFSRSVPHPLRLREAAARPLPVRRAGQRRASDARAAGAVQPTGSCEPPPHVRPPRRFCPPLRECCSAGPRCVAALSTFKPASKGRQCPGSGGGVGGAWVGTESDPAVSAPMLFYYGSVKRGRRKSDPSTARGHGRGSICGSPLSWGAWGCRGPPGRLSPPGLRSSGAGGGEGGTSPAWHHAAWGSPCPHGASSTRLSHMAQGSPCPHRGSPARLSHLA